VSEIRHQPPAPGKELPFLVLNMFHFPTEEAAKEYEANVRKWWPELHLFVGRMSGDVSEQYTHCIVWLYKDFDEYKRNREDYAASLAESEKPEGDWPGYLFDRVYACRVADDRDPVLLEHGIDEWTRRMLAASHGALDVPGDGDPDTVNEQVEDWSTRVSEKMADTWGAQALKRSAWE
jgi:hypothetical protein